MMAYGGASTLAVYDRGRLVHTFLADEGVKQGCPVAAFLFALSVQRLFAIESCVQGLEVEANAIADDLTITGPALAVLAALDRLVARCAADGPELALHKCRFLWPYSTHHPDYPEFLRRATAYGMEVRYDSIDLLGATVGLANHRAAHCLSTVERQSYFFSACAHDLLPAQVALHFLRSRLGCTTYLARVTPPSILRSAAERFDERVLLTVAAKVGLPRPHPSRLLHSADHHDAHSPWRAGLHSAHGHQPCRLLCLTRLRRALDAWRRCS
jgi:hypothetical protein